MKSRNNRYFVADFETTVYKGQVNTEVWAAACVELFTEEVNIFHSINDQFNYFISLNSNIICYYHNLKFDGSFWLSYFMIDLGLKQAIKKKNNESEDIEFLKEKDMPNNSFTYSISGLGQWYSIKVKIHEKIIEFRDSLKILPFSVKKIGESFGTKHKKLEMEYTGIRYAGCKITDEEKEYIKNDVLVVKEAVEIMFIEGHKRLTIGSCCLSEYKRILGGKTYIKYYPNLYEIPISENFGAVTAGDYIRNSYHGGWCYLVKGKEKKIYNNGTTADVNSLYPSMMSSESGNIYPIGKPVFWTGNYIPNEAIDGLHYYFIRFKTRFYIKKNMLPFVQIKNTLSYRANEMLETSDMYNKEDGKYYSQYYDFDGKLKECIVTMTMTMTDFRLFVEHYDLVDFEILDGCYFKGAIGIFDEYIEKYKKIKITSKGAQRELAKLFLNNLYGKMASSPSSNFKIAYVKDDKTIGFYTQLANDKEPGYIAVGSAITSYARNFTIRAAQKNYYGPDKDGFIYADTDSIHCSLPPEKIIGIKSHPTNFCCWKLESCWDIGYFVRQKTYIEHIIKENCEDIEKPYYNIKCAGMPEKCKKLFVASMEQNYNKEWKDNLSNDEKEFVSEKRNINDFDVGLIVPGRLMPKRILGGIVLIDKTYEMR